MRFDLDRLIANRRWWKRDRPFRHVVARNVFAAHFYAELEAAFRALMARGLDEGADPTRLARPLKHYDAYTLAFKTESDGPFAVFLSRPWHDLLARLFDIRNATGDVDGGLHHHVPNSPAGWVHSDLAPGYFADHPRPDGVNVSDERLCSYYHGAPAAPGVTPRATVRAVACLYYFANDWQAGDGGETGIYLRHRDPVDRPAGLVPPIDNSLLAFECTPFSYHTFVGTRAKARNAVVMWIHRPMDDAVRIWGDASITRWGQR